MATTYNLDFKNFTRNYPALVRRSVESSHEKVCIVLACSEGARWNHEQGCANSSRPSSVKGALVIAHDLVATAPVSEWEDEIGEPFFGAHIRRAVRTIRAAMRG
jgi:hypothetical protein